MTRLLSYSISIILFKKKGDSVSTLGWQREGKKNPGFVLPREHLGLDENAWWAICMMRYIVFFGLRLKTRDPLSPRFPSRHISTARAKTCSEYSNDRGNSELMVVNVHFFFLFLHFSLFPVSLMRAMCTVRPGSHRFETVWPSSSTQIRS